MIDTFDLLAVMIVAFRMDFSLLRKMAICKINKHLSELIKFDNKYRQSK